MQIIIMTLKWKFCHFDKILPLTGLEVVIVTVSGAASDKKFLSQMTFPFQWQQKFFI